MDCGEILDLYGNLNCEKNNCQIFYLPRHVIWTTHIFIVLIFIFSKETILLKARNNALKTYGLYSEMSILKFLVKS